MNHAEKARDLFREGYNCAQSVVGAFHEEMGLSLSLIHISEPTRRS